MVIGFEHSALVLLTTFMLPLCPLWSFKTLGKLKQCLHSNDLPLLFTITHITAYW